MNSATTENNRAETDNEDHTPNPHNNDEVSTARQPTEDDNKEKKKKGDNKKSKPPGNGLSAGVLAIVIYYLMHESGMMTLTLLALVWHYSLEEAHQRIFLFFLVILNFMEYFYLLPPALARYQQEDWWDIPTIKTALLTMGVFWSIAWFSAWTGSYLEHREQQLKLLRIQQREQLKQAILREES